MRDHRSELKSIYQNSSLSSSSTVASSYSTTTQSAPSSSFPSARSYSPIVLGPNSTLLSSPRNYVPPEPTALSSSLGSTYPVGPVSPISPFPIELHPPTNEELERRRGELMRRRKYIRTLRALLTSSSIEIHIRSVLAKGAEISSPFSPT